MPLILVFMTIRLVLRCGLLAQDCCCGVKLVQVEILINL